MNKKRLKNKIFILSLVVLLTIGATAAFLSSRDNAENWFTVAKVDLDLTEKFDENRTLAAGEKITKEPSVKNTGTTNQLFIATVCVPVMTTTLVDSNGERIAPKGLTVTAETTAAEFRQKAEIFNLLSDKTDDSSNPAAEISHKDPDNPTEPADPKYGTFTYNDPASNNNGEGWYFLQQGDSFTVSDENKVKGFQNGEYNTYIFAYNAWVAPGASTIPIFNKLQLRNMIDGEIPGDTLSQVNVKAYTIQANELKIDGLSGNGSNGTYYTAEDLKEIYKVIENKENTAEGE